MESLASYKRFQQQYEEMTLPQQPVTIENVDRMFESLTEVYHDVKRSDKRTSDTQKRMFSHMHQWQRDAEAHYLKYWPKSVDADQDACRRSIEKEKEIDECIEEIFPGINHIDEFEIASKPRESASSSSSSSSSLAWMEQLNKTIESLLQFDVDAFLVSSDSGLGAPMIQFYRGLCEAADINYNVALDYGEFMHEMSTQIGDAISVFSKRLLQKNTSSSLATEEQFKAWYPQYSTYQEMKREEEVDFSDENTLRASVKVGGETIPRGRSVSRHARKQKGETYKASQTRPQEPFSMTRGTKFACKYLVPIIHLLFMIMGTGPVTTGPQNIYQLADIAIKSLQTLACSTSSVDLFSALQHPELMHNKAQMIATLSSNSAFCISSFVAPLIVHGITYNIPNFLHSLTFDYYDVSQNSNVVLSTIMVSRKKDAPNPVEDGFVSEESKQKRPVEYRALALVKEKAEQLKANQRKNAAEGKPYEMSLSDYTMDYQSICSMIDKNNQFRPTQVGTTTAEEVYHIYQLLLFEVTPFIKQLKINSQSSLGGVPSWYAYTSIPQDTLLFQKLTADTITNKLLISDALKIFTTMEPYEMYRLIAVDGNAKTAIRVVSDQLVNFMDFSKPQPIQPLRFSVSQRTDYSPEFKNYATKLFGLPSSSLLRGAFNSKISSNLPYSIQELPQAAYNTLVEMTREHFRFKYDYQHINLKVDYVEEKDLKAQNLAMLAFLRNDASITHITQALEEMKEERKEMKAGDWSPQDSIGKKLFRERTLEFSRKDGVLFPDDLFKMFVDYDVDDPNSPSHLKELILSVLGRQLFLLENTDVESGFWCQDGKHRLTEKGLEILSGWVWAKNGVDKQEWVRRYIASSNLVASSFYQDNVLALKLSLDEVNDIVIESSKSVLKNITESEKKTHDLERKTQHYPIASMKQMHKYLTMLSYMLLEKALLGPVVRLTLMYLIAHLIRRYTKSRVFTTNSNVGENNKEEALLTLQSLLALTTENLQFGTRLTWFVIGMLKIITFADVAGKFYNTITTSLKALKNMPAALDAIHGTVVANFGTILGIKIKEWTNALIEMTQQFKGAVDLKGGLGPMFQDSLPMLQDIFRESPAALLNLLSQIQTFFPSVYPIVIIKKLLPIACKQAKECYRRISSKSFSMSTEFKSEPKKRNTKTLPSREEKDSFVDFIQQQLDDNSDNANKKDWFKKYLGDVYKNLIGPRFCASVVSLAMMSSIAYINEEELQFAVSQEEMSRNDVYLEDQQKDQEANMREVSLVIKFMEWITGTNQFLNVKNLSNSHRTSYILQSLSWITMILFLELPMMDGLVDTLELLSKKMLSFVTKIGSKSLSRIHDEFREDEYFTSKNYMHND